MKILILGAGRVGGSLARELVDNGYDVSVIDLDKNALSSLEENLDILKFKINKDNQEIEALLLDLKNFKEENY